MTRAPPRLPPFAAPRASTRQAPRPPPAFEAPPQPSTSGWVPPGPPPPRSRHDSEASESASVLSARDSASARLADLIYEVCHDSRPLFALKAPRCGFEAWFGQPEAAASTQRFRMYPRVAEVQEEVAARSESLARRSKPLSRVIPARTYALADDAVFASSQPVNSAFVQLAGSRALGSRRWGSLTFSDMERLERLFQGQLEVTSSSLWLLSGFLAMLKRDRFQPSDPALFNTALSSVFCCLVTSGAYGCCRLWLPSCQASGELTRPYHSPCSRISEALPDYHSRVVFWIFLLGAPLRGSLPSA